MTRNSSFMKSVLLFVVLAMLCTNAQQTFADGLPEAAGVSGGVAVHIGCDDGRLTAALHTSD